MKKITKTFRFSRDVIDLLNAKAAATERTLTQIIERAIRAYCKSGEKAA